MSRNPSLPPATSDPSLTEPAGPAQPAAETRTPEKKRPSSHRLEVALQQPEEAYERWFNDVWRLLRRLGVTLNNLDDAAQDVFVVVFKRWHDFSGRSSRRTWVLGIAIRIAHQYHRLRHKHQSNVDWTLEEDHYEISQRPTLWGNPFGAMSVREGEQRLQELLTKMTKKERGVFVLVELEELAVGEAADVLGVSARAAYRRLDRARLVVKKEIQRLRARDQWRLS